MWKLSQSFISARQLSDQETVQPFLLELCLRKCFTSVTFINASFPNYRIRILKPETELDELNGDSADIFNAGIKEKILPDSHWL